ncbi:hypothetical protein QBC36DRAFT_143814, partial [Triangularia setosa]
RPRGAEPPIFTGQGRTSARARQEEYTNWRSLVKVKMTLDCVAFPTPAERILYISQYLQGDAFTRVRALVESVTDNPHSPSTWLTQIADYTGLFTILDPVYITIDVYSESVRLFEGLEQGEKTSFADFIAEFIKLADLASVSNRGRVHALKKKVNKGLRDALVSVTQRPGLDEFDDRPDGTAGWVSLFRQLNNNILDREFQTRTNTGTFRPPPPINTAPDGDAMNLNRVLSQHQGGPRGPLSPEEKERRRTSGLCLYCGSAGHYAGSCPNRRPR